jgi:hypothetical protein
MVFAPTVRVPEPMGPRVLVMLLEPKKMPPCWRSTPPVKVFRLPKEMTPSPVLTMPPVPTTAATMLSEGWRGARLTPLALTALTLN